MYLDIYVYVNIKFVRSNKPLHGMILNSSQYHKWEGLRYVCVKRK